jgi:hypothetical protein
MEGAVKIRRGGPADEKGATGPVPDDNEPGHHPQVEQDKPTAVPEAYQTND